MNGKRQLMLTILLYAFGAIGIAGIAVTLVLNKPSVFLYIGIGALVAAAAVAVVTAVLKKKDFSKSKVIGEPTAENLSDFGEITKGDFFPALFDYVEKHSIAELPEFLKTYYVLSELFDAMGETGFDEFFINSEKVSGELIACCENFGNAKLLAICQSAVELDKKYNLRESEKLTEKAAAELRNLNCRFYKLEEREDLQKQLEDYFVKGYRKSSENPYTGSAQKKEYDFTDIPHFHYYDDKAVEKMFDVNENRVRCGVCGKVSKYIYNGAVYSENLETVCPHCIESGLAYLLHGAEFTDIGSVEKVSDRRRMREVASKTPSYETNQDPVWLACCDDMCKCLGKTEWSDIVKEGTEEKVKRAIVENPEFKTYGMSLDELIEAIKEDECALCLFECGHCGKLRAYFDFG